MPANSQLSDRGLIRGSFKLTIDGYDYVFKTFTHDKPVRMAREYDENGRPFSSSYTTDFQKLSGEIMAYAGTPEPAQLFPFAFEGKFWTISNLKLNGSTEGVRSYSADMEQLAGTLPADFVTTP